EINPEQVVLEDRVARDQVADCARPAHGYAVAIVERDDVAGIRIACANRVVLRGAADGQARAGVAQVGSSGRIGADEVGDHEHAGAGAVDVDAVAFVSGDDIGGGGIDRAGGV